MSDPNARLERELGLFLRRATASASAMAAAVHPDLDSAAYPLLVWIGDSDDAGIRSSELAERVGVGRATISRQVRRIEELGLIDRRPDPDDSRGQLLKLTAEGARRLAEAQDARRGWLAEALSAWSRDDVTSLATYLERLNAAIDEALRRT